MSFVLVHKDSGRKVKGTPVFEYLKQAVHYLSKRCHDSPYIGIKKVYGVI